MITASLDMGSEKMVMAWAETGQGNHRLLAVKYLPSQGMERGMVKDWEKMRACVQALLSELTKEHQVDVLNVALAGKAVHVFEKEVTVAVQKKTVEQGDLNRALARCREELADVREEVVDLIPFAYSVDKSEPMANPLGKSGHYLKVTYQVYTADADYLSKLRGELELGEIGKVCFYPATRAYVEGLNLSASDNVALVDLGAMGIQMASFREGLLEYDAYLPLGTHAIDKDIMTAYKIDVSQAQALKHEEGQAYRAICKNRSVQIPGTRLTLDSRDLSMIIQSRAEELLEGVVFLLQKWGFDSPNAKILLTGGGSNLRDVDVLLHRISGCAVEKAVVVGVQASKENVLQNPDYFMALALLLCEPVMETAAAGESSLKNVIKKFFGI